MNEAVIMTLPKLTVASLRQNIRGRVNSILT